MQCGEVICHSFSTMTKGSSNQGRPEKESIHSGHFMVSHFEAEAQDDEDDLAVALPDESDKDNKVAVFGQVVSNIVEIHSRTRKDDQSQQISIDSSLNKLFQCMTLAYRQKLTSPKWNRFKGIKLRWKDKIRLNNVIWRCWHMQFILKQSTPVCQFASPLDVDTHIKPEATILEGKYWKRRAEAVTAEYKKWRMYYKNKTLGWGIKDVCDNDVDVLSNMDVLDCQSQDDENLHMLVDEDYLTFMSDTLFSSILTPNQPFAFPDTREIARGASLADFIQPSLGPLQPNLDFMDTLDPFQELLSGSKLAPVPEETTIPPSYMDQNLQPSISHPTAEYNKNTPLQTTHISQQIHGSSNNQNNMMLQTPMSNDLTLNQSACLDNRHNANMLSRQGQHPYMQQGGNLLMNQSNTTNNAIMQQQTIMLQQPTYNVVPNNIVNQQQSVASNPVMQPQQSVLTPNNSQQQMQKQHPSYMQQNQKIYPQASTVTNYSQDKNFNFKQGHQQTNNENNMYMNRLRTNSAGAGGYSTERRNRPIAPAPHPNFAQYMGGHQQTLPDKASYNEHVVDGNRQGQSMNPKGQMYIGTHVDQNMVANLTMGNNARFKMPSPPPQITGNSQIRIQPNYQQLKKKQAKTENYRSNSLPLGVTMASIMGLTCGNTNLDSVTSASKEGSTNSGSNRGRRPRSGSSSPAPSLRRGPAPLIATASEPLLKDSSVLLAHLLNAKGQEFLKPNSIQSIPTELQQSSSQPHPVALIQSPMVNQMQTSSSKLIPFGSNSPTGLPSPQSPLSPGSEGKGSGGEHRRVGHMHAEQKRRYNIKNGFDLLQSLIPQLDSKSKISKAALLQKGAEHIKQLQAERALMKDDIDNLKQQIDSLMCAVSNCQSLLPATGGTVSRQRSGRLKEMFDDYVREKTQENWKFWVFSLLVEHLLESFNSSVSPASPEELKRSTYLWAEQRCSLMEMRPAALNSLRTLSTTTDILRDPDKLPSEALAAIVRKRSDSLTSQKK